MKGKDSKPHIGIFGRRNNGKSSFINLICGQEVAIVSDFAGTTTDPVKKSVEIFGIGPTIIIDTAGIDDFGELGSKRIEKTFGVIKTIDLAILLLANNEFDGYEENLIKNFKEYDVPFLVFHNKSDEIKIDKNLKDILSDKFEREILDINTLSEEYLEDITAEIRNSIPKSVYIKPSLLEGMVKPKDMVLLVTPIDSEAPEGRMILPQQMAIRDVLDHHCICVCLRETELEDFMKLNIKPSLVITDSQAFKYVSEVIPDDIPLTGFSIVFARMKANFEKYIEGTPHLSKLKENDKILILESCTHHLSCEDIGRYKLPKWIKEFSGKNIEFEVIAGLDNIKGDINDYAMLIQCGGCVATKKQIANRLKPAIEAGIPVSNYGMAIAWLTGIFDRSIEPFQKIII